MNTMRIFYMSFDFSVAILREIHSWNGEGGGTEAVAQSCSVKKVFLRFLQKSQENNCARVSFLTKLQTEFCNFI